MFKISSRSQDNLHFFFVHLLEGIALSLGILTLGRLSLLFAFAFEQFLEIAPVEKVNFFVLGLRYDLKVICIAYAPILLAALIFFATGIFRKLRRAFVTYSFVMMFIMTIFCVINFFYYKTYDRCIDTFIFAFTKEDPMAVFKTIINDYPVFTGTIGLVLFVILFKKLYKKLIPFFKWAVRIPSSIPFVSVFLIFTVVLFAGLIRGSFGTFPLRQLNASVCDKLAVNYCVPNALLDFYWAYKWEKLSVTLPVVTIDQVKEQYKNAGIEIEGNYIFDPLKHVTAKNEFLEQNKPDVVFSVMESMSTHMLSLDNGGSRDLLGALRENIKEDMFFTRFVSEGDGTSDSLTRLLVSVPDLNLSTSNYFRNPYICNIVNAFKSAGYETIFVTASTASWRNYEAYLNALGFDRIIERAQVQTEFPDATMSAWGIDDEYLFRKTFSVLKEKHDKPRFIMTLSITNHPPFRLPKNVDPQKIALPQEILERFPYADTETIFATFRYANDQLGRFIDAVKGDKGLKDKTFIAATGDHNMRGIGYGEYPEELVFGHEVPFYLYMPKKYIANTAVNYDPKRRGSHKDIITTVLSHAVSDHTFYSFGCDLLSDEPCRFDFAYNNMVAVPFKGDHACMFTPDGSTAAYKITDEDTLYVEDTRSEADCSKEKAFENLQRHLYYLQANLPQGVGYKPFLKPDSPEPEAQ